MKKAFTTLIDSTFSFLKDKPVLVAVSGGLDSTVLAHLCQEAGLDFAIAHCNFKLRGSESDADAIFVSEMASGFSKEVFVQAFDTEAYASSQKISIQMAARELRYAWFEELCVQHNFEYILTAHHAQDDLETFLINLGRGTGIDGLTGIPETNQRVVRPLLNFSREQIKTYAEEQGISWREDSSNASDKYLRNHLRHQAIPALTDANTNFLNGFQNTVSHLRDVQDLLEDYTTLLYSKIVTESFKGYDLNIDELKRIPNTKAVLYQLLKGFGFTAWDDIYDLLDAQPGKQVISGEYRLLKDRNVLILTEHKQEETQQYLLKADQDKAVLPGMTLKVEKPEKFEDCSLNEAIFDADLLEFPLCVRRWQEGDAFYPFGMRGKKKKLSKLFKDLKYSTVQKEAVWVVCSGIEIIWVVNVRSDDRFKVTPATTRFIKLIAHYD